MEVININNNNIIKDNKYKNQYNYYIKNKCKIIKCEICDGKYIYNNVYNHNRSFKHLKALGKQDEYIKYNNYEVIKNKLDVYKNKIYHCDVCNKDVNYFSKSKHLEGKNHLYILNLLKQ